MKKIYLFLLLTLSFSSIAQQNCNVGNFEDIANSEMEDFGDNYNLGNKYFVTNPGTVTALNFHSASEGTQLKLYLYKVMAEGGISYIASTNLTTSIVGPMTLPITATAIEAGEYFIFVNLISNDPLYYKENSNIKMYLFEQYNDDTPLQSPLLDAANYIELYLGMTITCGDIPEPEPQPIPTCVLNKFERYLNYYIEFNTAVIVPLTITENKEILDFQLLNHNTDGQFKLAIYKTSNNNLSELVYATDAISPVSGMQTIVPNQNITLTPGTYAVGIFPNQQYQVKYTGFSYAYGTGSYIQHDPYFDDLENDLHAIRYDQGYERRLTLEINYNCATASATDFNQTKMAVYPNPATNNIQIAGLTQDVKYGIFNVLGAQVASGMASENASINIDKLSNGMYIIKLENGQNIKFIKE